MGIARCLLADPSICLLDEATSALDVRTERALAEAMEELMRGRFGCLNVFFPCLKMLINEYI